MVDLTAAMVVAGEEVDWRKALDFLVEALSLDEF